MHLKTSNRTTSRARPMTVHFPVPRKAVSKLRELAVGRDSRLLDLGVLAVQISDDESIVLGIELDKTKKKSPVYVNKVASSTYAHSSGNRVSFNPKTLDPRSFTTPSPFDPLSHNYGGATYASQFLQTARTDNFGLKTKKTAQNSATKRRAKETLNAARRGRGRGRAGKASGQSNASVRASTWEMVYSHIGLPRDRGKARNLLEPSVGSQASGVANVPVAQTELPKESFLNSDRKRKISASSPPLKSPGPTGVYSEDDSSVSSSPCSHSPMNSEELMNLFVDSNFSATSVLKQLAESCSKGEEKLTDSENNLAKTDNSLGSSVEGHPNVKESGTSNAASHGSSTQCGNFPNTGTPVSAIKNSNSVSTPKTSKPVKRVKNNVTMSSSLEVGPSGVNLSNTSSLNLSSAPGKRPASMLDDIYCGIRHVSSKSSPALSKSGSHDPQSKRARTELEIKRAKLNKANEQNLQKSTDSLTLQSLIQPKTSSLSPSNDHLDNTSVKAAATTEATNVALRNYLQYGYYYSAEDLNRALAKTGSLKSKNNHQAGVSASSPSSTVSTNSVPSGAHTVLKSKTQNEQQAFKEPAPEVLLSNPTEQQTVDPSHKTSDCSNSETILKTSDSSKMEEFESMTSSSDIHKFDSSSSNENLAAEKSQSEAGAQSLTSSESDTPPAVAITTSSPTLMTSSDATPLTGTGADSSSNIQSNGKCYAISYVYPMGTVWYPYVAITPYTVLQNASKSSEPEKTTNDKDGTSGGGNTSSQYIDLASSLRYWQQLSLLYKNQMLVTASGNTNIFGSSLSTLGQGATGVTSNMTSGVSSDLSKQSTTISVMGSTSERAPFSFTLSESGSSVASVFSKQPVQGVSSNPSSSEKKPVRRTSVIVAAKTPNTGSSSRANSTESLENRSSSSTPESDVSSDGMPLVIDNCNRLIEEHCNRMNAVLAGTPEDQSDNHEEITSSTTPLLSFIPDSSIAYVNVGNNSSKKTAGNGKDGKSKSSKKKKSTKAM